jgi:hypothetical protein
VTKGDDQNAAIQAIDAAVLEARRQRHALAGFRHHGRVFVARCRDCALVITVASENLVWAHRPAPVPPCAAPQHAGDGDPGDTGTLDLVAVEKALLAAVARADSEGMAELLAEDFRYTGTRPGPLGKVAWIEEVTRHLRFERLDIRDATSIEDGDSGILLYRLVEDAVYDGASVTGVFGIVDVWHRVDGRWSLVSRYARRLHT